MKLTIHVAPLQKSANILLARDFTAKIADVGECVRRAPFKLSGNNSDLQYAAAQLHCCLLMLRLVSKLQLYMPVALQSGMGSADVLHSWCEPLEVRTPDLSCRSGQDFEATVPVHAQGSGDLLLVCT